jgi:hypothetical protein
MTFIYGLGIIVKFHCKVQSYWNLEENKTNYINCKIKDEDCEASEKMRNRLKRERFRKEPLFQR